MNLKNPIEVKTNYNFKVYRNGVLRQEVNTHNVICTIFYKKWGSHIWGPEINMCPLQVGSGVDIPSALDTSLTSLLWTINCDSSDLSYHLRETEDDVEWCQLTNKYTIPASTSYVGTIAECGLYSNGHNQCLITHSLLLDAEGNAISINKTDLDIVIIEVSIRFYFNNTEDIKVVPAQCTPFYRLFRSSDSSGTLGSYLTENVEALWSLRDPLTGNDMYPLSGNSAIATYFSTFLSTTLARSMDTSDSADRGLREVNVQGARLGSDFSSPGQHFIRGLRVGNMFIIPFPNEDIFPRYKIENMEVGIGDGITTEFVCPMNYFIEDTDEIYVDGILQVRGVDYTVECDNNNQMLPELMASNDAIITGPKFTLNSSCVQLPLFRAAITAPKIIHYYSSSNPINYSIDFDSSSPLFFDMEKEVKVNTFQIGKNYNYSSSGNIYYTLWASDDGEKYEELATIIKLDNTQAYKVTFDTVIKRYYKVTVSTASSYVSVGYIDPGSCSNYFMPKAIDKDELCLFGYVGHGIQFTNPPAEDAIITMSVYTDLPMKNENFVFDVNMKLTY